jgi:hypothetical protein
MQGIDKSDSQQEVVGYRGGGIWILYIDGRDRHAQRCEGD